jgi:hypothetical protein
MSKMQTGSWPPAGNYTFQVTHKKRNVLSLVLGLYNTHKILSLHIRKLYGRNSKVVVYTTTTVISRLQANVLVVLCGATVPLLPGSPHY